MKERLTFTEQVDLLKNRNLKIDNDIDAVNMLSCISYYRLNSYRFPFWDKESNSFYKDVDINKLFELYVADSNYRKVIFGLIEHIEVALRTQIMYSFSKLGKDCYYKNKFYQLPNNNGEKENLDKFIKSIKKSSKNCNNVHIAYYKEINCECKDFKSCKCYPDIWVSMESFDFGQLIGMFSRLNHKYNDLKKEVCDFFGLVEIHELINLFTDIRRIRNIVCHSDKLLDRYSFTKPKSLEFLKNKYPEMQELSNKTVKKTFIYYFLSIKFVIEALIKENAIFETIILKDYKNFLFLSNQYKDYLSLKMLNEKFFII